MQRAENRSATWDLGADTTLVRLLARNAEVLGDHVAMREKHLGIWQETTWAQMLDATLAFAASLQSMGFGKEDALLVLGDNRPNLYMGMLAAGALGGYAMPAYPDATPDEIRHFMHEANARFVLAEDQEQVDKALDLGEVSSSIKHIIYDEPRGLASYQHPGLVSWDKLQTRGVERLRAEPSLRKTLIESAKPEGPAVFVHSSGTTGKPKGVVLSHKNILTGVGNAFRGGAFDFGESVLAYLPMAWVGDFAITMGAGVALHFVINIPERQETVLHDLREVAPSFYLAAPRSWDNMLTTIQVRMEDSTPLKKWLYDVFMNSALTAERQKLEGKPVSLKNRLLRPLGELLIFGPIKDQFGLTRLRHAFTGGEAIGEDTFVFYRALGVKLRQFYGQTESSAFNALQDPQEVRLHTVGKPLPGVEVKIADNGEIMLRSGSVFSGYYKLEKATQEALENGWLHTGDAGYLEPDGHIVVLGRLSEVVYTAKGERFIPNYIENRLKFSPYIKDAAVLGKDRDSLAVMVCIDKETVGHWAEVRGISYMSYADLSQNPEVIKLITEAVQRVNGILPDALKLRHFVSLHKEFDPDDGEVTRTRKLRRNVIEQRYAPIIDAIYSGKKSVTMKAQITYETGEVGSIERELAIQEV
ncbi:MAG: AMP-dependent synthetase/ligase [Pseudomonadota bacterium]